MGGVFVVGGRDLHYALLSNVAPLSAPMPKCALQKPLMLYFDLKKLGSPRVVRNDPKGLLSCFSLLYAMFTQGLHRMIPLSKREPRSQLRCMSPCR